jgi:peptidoglycan/xylan/chitin deacetylase (PgdA/CDA1 family)
MQKLKEFTKKTLNSLPIFNNYFIWEGEKYTKKIALTFDDGPIPRNTERLLKILSDTKSLATFFLIGKQLEKMSDLGLAIYKEGHCIGNHTYSHRQLDLLKNSDAVYEILRGIDSIQNIISINPLKLFRPPKGDLQWTLIPFLFRNKIKTVFWSIDPQDYLLQSPEKLFSYLSKQKFNGGEIILLHDKIEATIKVLPDFIHYMQNSGFQFVTIPNLFTINR